MFVEFTGAGLYISLGLKDKKEGIEKGIIKSQLNGWKKPKLFLHVVEEVIERGFLEEPGFHIKTTPERGGPEFRTQYDIYLSKERFDKLTNPEEDPIVRGGYFVSRSKYDRVDIVYFAV